MQGQALGSAWEAAHGTFKRPRPCSVQDDSGQRLAFDEAPLRSGSLIHLHSLPICPMGTLKRRWRSAVGSADPEQDYRLGNVGGSGGCRGCLGTASLHGGTIGPSLFRERPALDAHPLRPSALILGRNCGPSVWHDCSSFDGRVRMTVRHRLAGHLERMRAVAVGPGDVDLVSHTLTYPTSES